MILRSKELKRCINLLPHRDRRKIKIVILAQLVLSGLDLLGVATVGILGALAVRGIQSSAPGNRVATILGFLNIENLTFQSQIMILGLVTAVVFIARTVASIYITKKTFLFLSRRSAEIASEQVSKVLSNPKVILQELNPQEIIYAATSGVSNLVLGVIGSGVVFISDAALLFVIAIGLLVVDPLMALNVILIFGVVGVFFLKALGTKARMLGAKSSSLSIESNNLIYELLGAFRENQVKSRQKYFATKISHKRFELADVTAEMQFLPNISKYVIESTLIIGALLVSAIQFSTQDASRAVAALAIFLAAGSRIAPAVMRMQQGAIQIKTNLGMSESTFKLEALLMNTKSNLPELLSFSTNHTGFEPLVEIDNVNFEYPNSNFNFSHSSNLKIIPGELFAIVGPSGSGKTTMVDLCLGILEPTKGRVSISGMKSKEAMVIHPGAIGYVPQDVLTINASLRDNICLGYDSNEVPNEDVWRAIEIAQLTDYVTELPLGLDTLIGDGGASMSGGQRQRMGVARALLTDPHLLILDESTSSLDSQTEVALSNAIKALGGKTTVIVIAHRLSTVRDADRVCYVFGGRIQAIGTFEEVRALVPEFASQAEIMGL